MDAWLKDLRYSIRRLTRSPGFATIVVLTLALGIGANSAIFSVVNGVLLRPLPYREPAQLVTVEHFYSSLNNLEAPISVPGFRDYSARKHIFQSTAVQTGWAPSLTGKGDPARIQASRATALLFSTLGVSPLLGRTFAADEDQPGKPRVVVLSLGFWQRVFAGDRGVLGKTVVLDNEPYEVIGVMGPEFRAFFGGQSELWAPLVFRPEQFTNDNRTNEFLSFTGRLAPGVTPTVAQRDMSAFAEQLKREYPDNYGAQWTLLVTSLLEEGTSAIRPALYILLGAVGFVLLIACGNVANLFLARAAARAKEVAVRSALGAEWWQLVRQLLTESVVVSVVGGIVGLALSWLALRALVAFNPTNLPRVQDIRIDPAVLVFTFALSIVTGLVFGLAPALQAVRTNLQATLKEGGRTLGGSSGHKVRRALVVAETALALTLLAGAGLLIRSFARIQGIDPGFQAERVLTFNLSLPNTKYPSDTQRIAFFEQLLPRLAAVPGVEAIGTTSNVPFGGNWSTGSFSVEGYQAPQGQPGPWGDIRVVSTGFFETLRVPVRAGRTFTPQDRAGSPRVVVVDEGLVRRYWPNENAIGKRITFGDAADSTAEWREIVGVVGYTKHEGLDAESRVQVYMPLLQEGLPFSDVVVRTRGDPEMMVSALRAKVQEMDRDLPLSRVSTVERLISESFGQRRFSMFLLGLFAALALVLASIGIYGVMSYSVAQRSHEMGLRMALGAARGTVVKLILSQGMSLVALGVGIGLVGAFALTRVLRTQLFGVQPTDPVTYVLVTLLLTVVAVIATLGPALRATRVDPIVALRQE
jgi:putative ABC transport system permease protein